VTVSTGTEAAEVGVPVERTRITLGRSVRVALVHGGEEASRRAVAHLALASGAEIVARIRATDPRSFVEAAQALRDARPDVVVIQGGKKDEPALAELLEALRLGCGAQRPTPRIFGLVETRVAESLRTRAGPFEFERFAAASEMVDALRSVRRAANEEIVLRDALIEDGARALATTNRTTALAVDVTERSTSLVLARPDGRLEAAHFVPLGLGMGADHVVVRASLDNVRRWLPWPIDAPALLERVFNRPRRPQDPATTTEAAVLLEMALAREAIAHALRDAADAGLDVIALRCAPRRPSSSPAAWRRFQSQGKACSSWSMGLSRAQSRRSSVSPMKAARSASPWWFPWRRAVPRRSGSFALPAGAWRAWIPDRSASSRSARTSKSR
jgi:hypothetical protein